MEDGFAIVCPDGNHIWWASNPRLAGRTILCPDHQLLIALIGTVYPPEEWFDND